ncbi:ABC transporter permease [Erysipelotrichaceae bacterium OttesenSCG-928-M19]|nr:ABC transporter permease [Erysipelotrichaceae bacterium OttesenSCG-928-M19]
MIEVIKLTLLVNISATLLGMLFGLLLGYQLYFMKSKIKYLLIYLTKTMMGLPPVVLGLVLFMLLKTNGAFGFLHILYQPISLVVAQTLLIIPIVSGNVYQLLVSKGEVLFFTLDMFKLNFINKIKYSLFEFRNDLIFILILGFSRAVSEVGSVMVVGGNIKDHTRIMTTALANLKSQGNYNEALIYGVILLLIAFIVQFGLSLLNKEEDNHENF